MNLYTLSELYRADVAKLQDLNLPPEAVLDTIDGMQGEISEKIKAVMVISIELEKLAAARKECAKQMADSAKSVEARADGLRSYAQIAIQNCGLSLPIKYPEFNINLQRNPSSCSIDDIEQLPTIYKTVEAAVTVNCENSNITSDGIAKALADAGIRVHGVKIEVKADKRAVLDALKSIEIENNKKKEGELQDRLPGAHLNPTNYRVTVK